jgi:hypothetical protein
MEVGNPGQAVTSRDLRGYRVSSPWRTIAEYGIDVGGFQYARSLSKRRFVPATFGVWELECREKMTAQTTKPSPSWSGTIEPTDRQFSISCV